MGYPKVEMERKMGFILAVLLMSAAAAEGGAVPAIYMFGDSTADVGNNNFLPGNGPKANFTPYGVDFPAGKPTGRFSNGYVGIDYLAKKLGFKMSPPAYLSIASDSEESQGVNFASGGSGIFDSTGKNVSIPMNEQVRFFGRASRRLRNRVGEAEAKQFLSKSLFCFSTANNDMFAFYSAFGAQNQSRQDIFIAELTRQFMGQLEALYKLGGRKFLVFGTSIIGCIPVLRALTPDGNCLEDLNHISRQFNQAVPIALRHLAANLKGFFYSFIDAYQFVSLLSSDPLKYGFTEAISACCGSGKFNGEEDCRPNSKYCSNRKRYIHWDRFHPTQAFQKTIIRNLSRGKRYASPVSIRQLIRH